MSSLGTIHLNHFRYFFSLSLLHPSLLTFYFVHSIPYPRCLLYFTCLFLLFLSLFPSDSPRSPTDLILLRRHGCTRMGAQYCFSHLHLPYPRFTSPCEKTIFFFFISSATVGPCNVLIKIPQSHFFFFFSFTANSTRY